MRRIAIIAALLLVASPLVAADEHGDPPDVANFGLCTADENNDTGDENSNGTVSDTPPFSSLDDDDCDDAQPPSGPEDTPGDGAGDDGSDAGDAGGGGSDAGSDNQPDGAGSQGSQAQSPSVPSHAAVALP